MYYSKQTSKEANYGNNTEESGKDNEKKYFSNRLILQFWRMRATFQILLTVLKRA